MESEKAIFLDFRVEKTLTCKMESRNRKWCKQRELEKKRENVKALSIVTGTRCGTVSNEIELHLKSFGIKQENLDQIQSTLPY